MSVKDGHHVLLAGSTHAGVLIHAANDWWYIQIDHNDALTRVCIDAYWTEAASTARDCCCIQARHGPLHNICTEMCLGQCGPLFTAYAFKSSGADYATGLDWHGGSSVLLLTFTTERGSQIFKGPLYHERRIRALLNILKYAYTKCSAI